VHVIIIRHIQWWHILLFVTFCLCRMKCTCTVRLLSCYYYTLIIIITGDNNRNCQHRKKQVLLLHIHCVPIKHPPFYFLWEYFSQKSASFYNFWCTRMVNALTISAVLLILKFHLAGALTFTILGYIQFFRKAMKIWSDAYNLPFTKYRVVTFSAVVDVQHIAYVEFLRHSVYQ